jgi:hypothetical protein
MIFKLKLLPLYFNRWKNPNRKKNILKQASDLISLINIIQRIKNRQNFDSFSQIYNKANHDSDPNDKFKKLFRIYKKRQFISYSHFKDSFNLWKEKSMKSKISLLKQNITSIFGETQQNPLKTKILENSMVYCLVL